MKKIILSGIILLLAMLTSCADRSFQGDGPDTPDIEILDEPVPVLLAIGDPSLAVAMELSIHYPVCMQILY